MRAKERWRQLMSKDQDESIVWLMCHHFKGAIALMEVALKNELVEERLLDEHLEEWESRSDSIWEQHLWFKFREAINRPDNVILFSPDSRGPDT
tara:strand:- start:57 stop:338 length:282 start_codon:yes stop_codon:yes gene_type:complete